MSKQNYTPRQIAFFTAFASFVIVFIVNILFTKQLWQSLAAGAAIFAFVYFVIIYYVTQILDKKISFIYKLINQTKAGKKEQFYTNELLPRPSLSDVTKDVAEWAKTNEAAFTLLEKNEQYRKEFLQNLNHEIKTPLFSIQGYVESLLDGALHDNSVNEKFLQNTHHNIKRLINLVNDLDAITKLENEKSQLQLSEFDIDELIFKIVSEIQSRPNTNNVRIQVSPKSAKKIKVKADISKIEQVLINLIDNAIKYSKPNGEVTVNVELLNSNAAIVEISDNGIGIAAEHLDRIFERFYRTDTARSRQIGGSGLGLAICKHIVEAHKQTLHVRSKIGVGTTFRFGLERV